MPKFRGSKNLHLGFDEKANTPEVSSAYDADQYDYVVELSAAQAKKWQAALEEYGFAEDKNASKSDEKADDSKE